MEDIINQEINAKLEENRVFFSLQNQKRPVHYEVFCPLFQKWIAQGLEFDAWRHNL